MSEAERKEWARFREEDLKRLRSMNGAEMRRLDEQYESARWFRYDDGSNPEWTDEEGSAWQREWWEERERAGFPSFYINYRANLLAHAVVRYERTMQRQRDQREASDLRRRLADPRTNAAALFEKLSGVLDRWRDWLRKMSPPRDLDRKLVADTVLAGLKDARIDIGRAAGEGWERRGDRFVKATLDFVFDMRCPTPEHHDQASTTPSVQLVVDKDANIEVLRPALKTDGEPKNSNACFLCDDESVWRVLLRCPLCFWGEWNDFHQPDHGLYQWRDEEDRLHGSRAPWAFVLARFELMERLEEARWFLAHGEQATEDQLERSRALIGAQAKRKPKEITSGQPVKPEWTFETLSAAADRLEIPVGIGAVPAYELAVQRDPEGHPPRKAFELYQRDRRATPPPA